MRFSPGLAFVVSALLFATACSDSGGGEPPILEPPPTGEGFQFVMNTTLGAGVEAEHCQFVMGPAEKIYVNRDEVRFTSGSHHFLMYETGYTSIPTMKDDGTVVDTSGVFDCSDGPTSGWDVVKLVGGSQNGSGDSILQLPAGIAMPIEANRVLLMNAHYVNATDTGVEPEVRINLWTIPEASVVTEGDILFIYNPLIRVAANSSERARWQCPVHEDITIVNVQSHMHARGVGYEAGIMGQTPFYTNTDWGDVPVGRFDPPIQVTAGSRLDYFCDYNNSSATDVYQGARSTDEMCMLIGSYYPRDARTANCTDATGAGLGGIWVGSGTATCNASLGCLFNAGGATDPIRAVTDCMLDSDPAVATEMSAAFVCAFTSTNPQVDCATEFAACQAI